MINKSQDIIQEKKQDKHSDEDDDDEIEEISPEK